MCVCFSICLCACLSMSMYIYIYMWDPQCTHAFLLKRRFLGYPCTHAFLLNLSFRKWGTGIGGVLADRNFLFLIFESKILPRTKIERIHSDATVWVPSEAAPNDFRNHLDSGPDPRSKSSGGVLVRAILDPAATRIIWHQDTLDPKARNHEQ